MDIIETLERFRPGSGDIMSMLSVPRPNGSRALRETVEGVRVWLENSGIPVRPHEFTLRPYFMELLGVWLMLTGLSLPIAAAGRCNWGGLVLALLVVGVPLLETRLLIPTISALIRQPACNLVVEFASVEPVREVMLCAHMDSKTELLDHYQRSLLLRFSLPSIVLALVCGVLIGIEPLVQSPTAARLVTWVATLLALPVSFYGLAMGVNLFGGRFSRAPSTGAADNGASVATLLALAQQLKHNDLTLSHTSVTMLLTVGEEAQMQGALAYVRDTEEWTNPTYVINLEGVGQNGGYLLWEREGTATLDLPIDPSLNDSLAEAVQAVTGAAPVRLPRIGSDAFAFLRRGIPASTLGGFDLELGGRGLHSALDAPERVHPERIAEAVEILTHLLKQLDLPEEHTHA